MFKGKYQEQKSNGILQMPSKRSIYLIKIICLWIDNQCLAGSMWEHIFKENTHKKSLQITVNRWTCAVVFDQKAIIDCQSDVIFLSKIQNSIPHK